MVRGQLRQIVRETSIYKITRVTCTGGVAQAVEGLLCRCEALSSNPSPTQKKKEREPKIVNVPYAHWFTVGYILLLKDVKECSSFQI
jgi:hypothetical protein